MQQCRLSSWHKREQRPSKQTSIITVSVPRVSISIITKRRHHQKKQCCDIGKKNNIKLFHFEMAEMLSWWFWVQYFFKERHFKCPLLFLQHLWLALCQTLRNLIPIFQSESSYLWPYLLCWPFLMGMLCIFVGKVLELLWKCDAGNRVWQLVSLCLQVFTTEVMYCSY